ncbi:hypothetical protein TRICHSKD4_4062 [Roseibium sp. TrichSKD4]|uniref:hypothetical protein n=1 Tax=Roseibium sp. TrichSKD4 TaxID=744980 RepID=UPI0001E570B3|nr:hypothetical protein [Roseibium sp. TrichSKD4]EFO30470.1 hypothetical protein TRICHSKD4_4062 [Roseibium sp. TrichSKD4]
MNEGKWVRVTEAEDAAHSIRHALAFATLLNEDEQIWKWLILALHSALQGACVCHLTTTAQPIGAVTKKNEKKWLEYFEASRVNEKIDPPQTYLMSLPDLLKKIRKPNSCGGSTYPNEITLSDHELSRLTKLHDEIRNQFVHFSPTGWAIEISGTLEIAKLVARIVNDILQAGWGFRHLSEDQKAELRQNLEKLSNLEMP